MTDCRDCGVRFYGAKTEHCTVCHETFAGARPGDSHRVGPPDNRRCRTWSEMLAGGMWTTVTPQGTLLWHGEFSLKGRSRRDTRHSPGAADLSDGQARTLTEVPPEKSGPQIGSQTLPEDVPS